METSEILSTQEQKKFKFYHFLKEEYLEDFLRTGLLKTTQLGHSNDYFEFKPAFPNFELERAWNKVIKQAEPCVICLSARMSSPTMWGHYGDQGKGVCLAFDIPIDKFIIPFSNVRDTNSLSHLYRISGLQVLIAEVLYTNERYILNDKYPFTSSDLNQITLNLACRKSLDWQYEREYRVIIPETDLQAKNGNLFYAGLHQYCSAVLLGWNCSITRLYLETVLNECEKKKIWILNTYPSRDKFEICTNNLNGIDYSDTEKSSLISWLYD